MTLLYNIYLLLFIDIKILKRYVCSRVNSAPHDETRVYQLTRNFQASLSAENNPRFNFIQPESLYLVSRPKTELRLYCRFLE